MGFHVFNRLGLVGLMSLLGFATLGEAQIYRQVGPWGGAGLFSLVATPGNPDHLLAKQFRTLYRSTDGGSTWRTVNLEEPLFGRDLTMHPQDPDFLVLGLIDVETDRGLRVSYDGGVSWFEPRAPQDPSRPFHALGPMFSSDGKTLFAEQADFLAAYFGPTRSTDRGRTWTECGEEEGGLRTWATDPNRPSRLMARFGYALYESTDGCLTWTAVESSLFPQIRELTIGYLPGEVWAQTDSSTYRSTDGGRTWTAVFDELDFISLEKLAIDPDRPRRVIGIDAFQMYVSEDSGATWNSFVPVGGSDLESITIPSGPGDDIFLLTRRGVEKSTDGGATWTELNRGLQAAVVDRLRFHPHRPHEIWAATRAGLSRSTDNGRSWQRMETGERYSKGFSDVQFDLKTGDIFAAAAGRQLVHSSDDGKTWTVDSSPTSGLGPHRLAVDPHQPGRVVTAPRRWELLRVFENGGESFYDLDIRGSVEELFFDPDIPDRMVLAGSGGILVVDELPSEPRPVTVRMTHQQVHSANLLARDPSNPAHYVTIHPENGNLWHSDDRAETWREVTGDLAAQIERDHFARENFHLVISPRDPNEIYVTTVWHPVRVWRTTDGGQHWHPAVEADISAQSLAISSAAPEQLWIGTSGQGIVHVNPGPVPTCGADGGAGALCLQSGRFEVTAQWSTGGGAGGTAGSISGNLDSSGLFWFFDPSNWELMIKVLDACPINGHFWIFAAGLTDVEYELRIEDLWTGLSRTYFNTLGAAARAETDTDGLAVCQASNRTSGVDNASVVSGLSNP